MAGGAERRLRLGMVGGGKDAFIGGVHRMAARLDDRFELVAGALSSTPERARESAAALGLDPARSYDSFEAMAKQEAARADGVDVVSIVTPNHVHGPAASAFLKHGIHVICDKPLTATMEQAEALKKVAEESDALFILTHNYSAYPMVRQARAMVKAGELGQIRVIQAEYPQDWLLSSLETQGQKQAVWRTDPAQSGIGGSVGDIGTHAYQLACFVSGLEGKALAADLHAFGAGRTLDDNAHILMRFHGGAKGMIWTSQIALGHDNGLKLRVYGEKGALEWVQEYPNDLWFTRHGEAKRLLRRCGAEAWPEALSAARIPPGHPEGYVEAFANLYREAATAIWATQKGAPKDTVMDTLPGLENGLKGMRFITACVKSAEQNTIWVDL